MSEYKDYFQNLIELTLREKEVERKQKDLELKSKTLKEKKKLELALHPIEWEEEPYSGFEKILLSIYRKDSKEISTEFRTGTTLKIYDLENQKNLIYGVISSNSSKFIQVLISLEELPTWFEKSNLVAELYYDESTYLEMEKALNILKNPKFEETKKLIAILLGKKFPSFQTKANINFQNLNESQNEAINYLLSAEEFGIVHGPPGTGKTKVLIELVKHLLLKEKQILLAAASNAAVDLLTQNCIEQGLKVVRVGNIARMKTKVLEYSLDSQIQTHNDFSNYIRWSNQAKEILKKTKKYKRSFTHEDKQNKKQAFKEAKELSKLAQKELEKITQNILENSQVITCTLSNLFRESWKDLEFQTVIVDEASQALEPLIWMSVLKAKKRIFLSGDSKQLSPTSFTNAFQPTLFEKLLQIYPNKPVNNFLEYQYRMHPSILEFSNIEFYNGKVLSLKKELKNFLSFSEGKGFIFIDTAGSDRNETLDTEMQSYFNEGEIEILFEIFQNELNNLYSASIGILSPYNAQVERLKQKFSQFLTLKDLNLEISTIDSFQGSERDVVFISLVRSNENKEIGFLKDYLRMNVAMTRAKEELVLIGDSETLLQFPFYSRMISHIEKNGKYISVWELIY